VLPVDCATRTWERAAPGGGQTRGQRRVAGSFGCLRQCPSRTCVIAPIGRVLQRVAPIRLDRFNPTMPRWADDERPTARAALAELYGVRGRNKSTNETETLNDSGGTTCVAADAATKDSARPMIPTMAHRAGRAEDGDPDAPAERRVDPACRCWKARLRSSAVSLPMLTAGLQAECRNSRARKSGGMRRTAQADWANIPVGPAARTIRPRICASDRPPPPGLPASSCLRAPAPQRHRAGAAA
jgi:hypothetical protein